MILDFGEKGTPSCVLIFFSHDVVVYIHCYLQLLTDKTFPKKLAISFTMARPNTFQLTLMTLWKHAREEVIRCP